MRVHYDDQIFLHQRKGGISRYFVELMQAYRADPSLGVEMCAGPMWTYNAHLAEAGMARRLPGVVRHRRLIKPPIVRAINRALRSEPSPDVVHHTYYDRRYLDLFECAGLRVVTIYDMIPERFPEMFPRGNPHRDKRAFVDAAALIVCISDATRRDLVELYGLPVAPIVVTPLGVGSRFHGELTRPNSLPERYVLYVGHRGAYKDFGVLAAAFAKTDVPDDAVLIAVGGGPLDDAELEGIAHLGISRRVRQVDLDDDALARTYAHALCFVFPSRYEGFGLPTLEAMASGCPTILANCSAHPEVGGDAALYFAPGNDEQLAAAISQVVADPALRKQLGSDGRGRARLFSWHETARRTASAYKEGLMLGEV